MEYEDKHSSAWKTVALLLIGVIICFGAYKVYGYAVKEVNAEIGRRVAEELSAEINKVRVAAYQEGAAAGEASMDAVIMKAAHSAYFAGYYANEVGMDKPSRFYFYLYNPEYIKKWLSLSDSDFAQISKAIEDAY